MSSTKIDSMKQIHGIRELIANCVLVADFRHAFLRDPESFLNARPWIDVTPDEVEQLMALEPEAWDQMTLVALNERLSEVPCVIQIINRND